MRPAQRGQAAGIIGQRVVNAERTKGADIVAGVIVFAITIPGGQVYRAKPGFLDRGRAEGVIKRGDEIIPERIGTELAVGAAGVLASGAQGE